MRGDPESRSAGRAARPLPSDRAPRPPRPGGRAPSRCRGAPRRPDREGRRGAGAGGWAGSPRGRPLPEAPRGDVESAPWVPRALSAGRHAPRPRRGLELSWRWRVGRGPAARRGASTFRPQRAPRGGRRRLGGSGPGVSLREPPRTPASRGCGRPARRPGSSFQQRLCVEAAPSSRCPRSPPKSPRDETLAPDARWARFWKTPGPGEGARLVPARRQPRGHLRAGARPGRPSLRPAAVRVLRRPSPRPGAGARLPTPCPAAPGRCAHWTRGEGTRRLGAAGAELAVAWGACWRSPASDLGAPLIPAAADVRAGPPGPAPVFN